MGRFETAAATYSRFRQPYPDSFFAAIAADLHLAGTERLIDLGTGPGVIALGMAPHVAGVVGVDPEPAMLEEARKAAAAWGVDLQLVAGRTEDLGADIGRFEVVTIGRAHHWMEPVATQAVLERILAPGGHIVVCGSRTTAGPENPWRDAFETLRRGWQGGTPAERQFDPDVWFAGSPFEKAGRIVVEHRRPVTIDHLFGRLLTMSSTSRSALGDRIDAAREATETALAPFFADGPVEETMAAVASVFVRAPR